MKNILIIGDRGTLGHVLKRYLKEQGYSVNGINRMDVDFSNYHKLIEKIDTIDCKEWGIDIIINCAGILKPNSKNRFQNAQINIGLPLVLADYCKEYGIKLITISTNCVFDDVGPHTEEETPNAKDLYGMSKAFGEINDEHNLTIRTSIIGPELKRGVNLFDWFVNQSGEEVKGYTGAIWNGVTTLELSKFIKESIEGDYKGLINFHTKEFVSKFEMLDLINELWGLSKKVIPDEKEGVHSSLLQGPHHTKKSLKQQLEELKEWY